MILVTTALLVSFITSLFSYICLPPLSISLFDVWQHMVKMCGPACEQWSLLIYEQQEHKSVGAYMMSDYGHVSLVKQLMYNVHYADKQSKRQRHWNDRFYQKFIIKSLNLYKTFTRRTSNGIMDGFIRKVNQKVNLPGFAILKDRFLKTRPIKRFHICLKM